MNPWPVKWTPWAAALLAVLACGTPGKAHPSFEDADGDGFGATPLSWWVLGGVPVGGDCDDQQAVTHPGAAEDCGPADRNCDGHPTAGATDMQRFYEDRDKDGDGTGPHLEGCVPPHATWVPSGTDCDDEDPTRSGVQPEIPYDGVDNDCDASTVDEDVDHDGLGHGVDCDDLDSTVGEKGRDTPQFEEVGVESGLALTPSLGLPVSACSPQAFAGGVALGDVDGDGDVDIFLPSLRAESRLMANDGTGHFTDVTAEVGIHAVGLFGAAVFFDLGGDGLLDLFVVSPANTPSMLWVQDTAGHFREESNLRGLALSVPDTDCAAMLSVTAGDLDDDGDVDLVVPSWRDGSPTFSAVLLDDGTGHFGPAPEQMGIDLEGRWVFTPSLGDVNADGYTDLAVTGDYGTSALFLSDGAGSFVEVAAERGLGTDENGMGGVLADYDGDLDLDWFVTAISAPTCTGDFIRCSGNRLYRNDGTGHFDDATDEAGVRDGAWGWGAAFFDVDNDGHLDLGHTNGFPAAPFNASEARLFMADGTGRFRDRACHHGMRSGGQGRAWVPFDMDRDGDLDVIITGYEARPSLFRNSGNAGQAWLTVVLKDGTSRNRSALGASVHVRAVAGGAVQRREVTANTTFAGVGPPEAHFGFGPHAGPLAEVRVVWPRGDTTVLTHVAPNRVLVVER